MQAVLGEKAGYLLVLQQLSPRPYVKIVDIIEYGPTVDKCWLNVYVIKYRFPKICRMGK